MADEKPSYELLMEEINNLKQENATLKQRNDTLEKKIDDVIELNRTLLHKPAPKVEAEKANNDKLNAYLRGD